MPTSLVRAHARPRSGGFPAGRRWAVLTTYPPTACGIASFSRSLITALAGADLTVDIVRIVDAVDAVEPPAPGVAHQWVRGQAGAIAATTAVLNAYDVVLVQHEFGIFPGQDGADVAAVLAGVRVPVVTVAHTVLTAPTAHQRSVMSGVLAASDAIVTMTRTAASRLIDGYGVSPDDVHVIPHGVADALVADGAHRDRALAAPTRLGVRPVVLTWGLLGTGKGIEWGIDAMAQLTDLHPRPRYVVAGRTHPRVLEREGEAYRTMLTDRAQTLGIADDVRFVDDYLDEARLHRLIRSATVVLLPYDSVDQVTSGVLSEAVAAGRPVVSTVFPHAVEVLSDGVGVLVPQRDAGAIATALRGVLTDGTAAAGLRARASAAAPELTWTRVADRYRALAESLPAALPAAPPSGPPSVRHCVATAVSA
ncbi:MAG: glycosyltransferase [Kineosporiaceae bacterium]